MKTAFDGFLILHSSANTCIFIFLNALFSSVLYTLFLEGNVVGAYFYASLELDLLSLAVIGDLCLTGGGTNFTGVILFLGVTLLLSANSALCLKMG